MSSPLSVFASSNSADGGLTGWTNPTFAYNDDGVQFATRAGTVKNTWYGTLFGFDLSSIPDGSIIDSVTLSAEWKNSVADSNGPVLLLGVKSGGVEGGNAQDTTGQTTFEVLEYAPSGLTAAELKATGANGFWAILRFRRTDNTAHTASCDYVKCVVVYHEPAVQLVIQDASHAHAADNAGLVQHNILAVQDATHSHTSDNVALVQHNILAIQDAAHSHAAENVTLVYHAPSVQLSIADASHGHLADNVTLTYHAAHYSLTVQEASHNHSADNVTLTYHPPSGVTLTIADATHGHSADNVTLIAYPPAPVALTIADATHAHGADNVVLTYHAPGGAVELVIQDAMHAHSTDSVILTAHLPVGGHGRHKKATPYISIVVTQHELIVKARPTRVRVKHTW